MNFWNQSRAYPDTKIPNDKIVKAWAFSKANLSKENKTNDTEPWKEIGPHNIGGRTISIAFNPQNPNTIYAGSASGGLWKTESAGSGTDAWDYVPTGFPVLGVSAIAFAPNDSTEFYIGTGELYNREITNGGVSIRETRGSYGIGILKTEDGGKTWTHSLNWEYQQGTCVWAIRVNPLNKNSVWAGTSEGTFKSTDAGKNWEKVNSTVMVYDLQISPSDTNTVLISCGNLFSNGHGIYKTVDNGNSWQKITSGLPAQFGGKALFSLCASNPEIVYLSIGNGYSSNDGTWLCRSNDFGTSWNIVNTFDYASYQGWFAHFAIVHNDDPNKLITAGIDVYKSTDGGVTLRQKSYWYKWDMGKTPAGGPEGPADYSHADHHSFAVHPEDPNIIYFGNDGGIFRTKDFGETFEGLNGGYQTTQFYNGFTSAAEDSTLSMGGMQDNATAIFDGTKEWYRAIGGDGSWTGINQQNSNIIYGSWQYLNMAKSTDRGVSWEYYIGPETTGNVAFVAPFALSPINSSCIYAAGTSVYKSTDGGNNWAVTNGGKRVSIDNPISISASPFDENVLFIGTAPNRDKARVFRTLDGGNTWKDVTENLPDRYVTDIETDYNDDATLYVTFSGFGTSHLFKSVDLGDSWIDIGEGLPDVPTHSVAVDPDYPENIYVGNDLGVYVSTNGGNSWREFTDGMPDAAMVTNLSVSFANRALRAATHGNGAFERKLLPGITEVAEENNLPNDYMLYNNYPNPFNPSTTISYRIPQKGRVVLKVYDILGKEVATLVNEIKERGRHEIDFNAKNLASGTYIYSLRVNDFKESKKMILLK